ncbi:MAG: hypothetical protein PHD97_00605 [Bacteroidales bacterium]|nr:hypothetical protein [Bacteroidales bacterium]
MLDDLTKYKQHDHFFFGQRDDLKNVCNAPTDKSGVYIVYALTRGKVKLYYIGCSGKLKKDGSIFIRKAGLGGIKDRIVNGHQFGKVPRKYSWPMQMKIEDVEALDIYWYVTHDEKYIDCPRIIENKLLQKHLDIYGRLPKWNKEL